MGDTQAEQSEKYQELLMVCLFMPTKVLCGERWELGVHRGYKNLSHVLCNTPT